MHLATVDMNYEYNFKINNECPCKIDLVLRDIIEMGIKPVIQNMAKIISASMTNTTLFGNYYVNFLFLLGNPFRLSTSSPVYLIYTRIVQEAICINIEIKGKDIQAFSFQESFYQLLRPLTREKPYMYDRFAKGVLSQTSLETYGVRFKENVGHTYVPFSCIDSKKNDGNSVVKDGNYFIILQKGQPISVAGLAIKLQLHVEENYKSSIEIGNYFCINYYTSKYPQF